LRGAWPVMGGLPGTQLFLLGGVMLGFLGILLGEAL